MAAIKKVAIAGATGNLGPAILTALRESKLFEVTVLTRKESNHEFPADVKVQAVDYTSEASLVDALQGQDGLVSTLSSIGVDNQKTLIDAAIAAGVQRFIPSEFGSNLLNAKVAKIPIFAPKLQIQEYLKEQATKTPSFSYTLVFPGAFLDWGLAAGLLVDVKNKSATLRDGGDVLFSVSRLSSIGQAVVGIFSHLQETANRAVHIKDIDTTQNQLISLAKEIDPSGEWKIEHANTETEEKEAYEGLAKGQADVGVILKFLFRAVYGEGYGGKIEKDDNELLGVESLDEEGLKTVVKAVSA
ncbi:hypothetical protein B0J13DRAFT_506722 [Dactylonectria estremocensis]|uniref:NmrA-like domain-containing protein n=1 Tax=Dactylonectria estremocensis TaxID=1079267 RepID=A0A9P9ECQ1_9HYPO|nr:hypothetical protein B0J13DRAFT_506722 [Dactylonectria estremocensis]